MTALSENLLRCYFCDVCLIDEDLQQEDNNLQTSASCSGQILLKSQKIENNLKDI